MPPAYCPLCGSAVEVAYTSEYATDDTWKGIVRCPDHGLLNLSLARTESSRLVGGA